MKTLLDYLNQYLDHPIDIRCPRGYFRHIQRRMPVFKRARVSGRRDHFQPVIVNLLIPEGSLVYVPEIYNLSLYECREYRLAFYSGVYCPVDGPGRYLSHTKLRFSQAQVHSIADMSGNSIRCASSLHNPGFKYRVGATVRPNRPFSRAQRSCDSGIHAFLTVNEAAWYRY